ncbi:MAG: hypothetical protein JOY99_02435 [Sphingomonadaceae bacterium]|nr:hypothetical protein [Sphingomonadaceae bacterium]
MTLRTHLIASATLALGLATPLLAQSTPAPLPDARTPAQAQAQYNMGYNAPNSPTPATGNPGTTALNASVAAGSSGQVEGNAAAQAQYANDMAAYRDAVRQNHHEAMRDQAHYAHQQRAYADAMEAWRMQSDACKHGNQRACNAPTPSPADFY